MKKITIRPVTRIEGHAAVDLFIDDNNKVKDAIFHVEELRGFEVFCLGRKVWELPRITTRACGICPVSHHLASAKATDALFNVQIPETAAMLRELMHMGQIVHSHSLHFFFLAAPDFLFGEPAMRNVMGIAKTNPDLAKKAIELRRTGQDTIKRLGGKAIHPVTAIPGGMSTPLKDKDRESIKADMKKAVELAKFGVELGKDLVQKNLDLVNTLAVIKTGFMGLVKNGSLEMYDGKVRLDDESGKRWEEFDDHKYLDYIGERVEDFSYLKFPFYKKMGWPKGIYRVGPLGRINVCDKISTPLADNALKEFRKSFGKPAHPTLLYNYARLIEILYAAERGLELVSDPKIMGKNVRNEFKVKAGEGVGVIEAPRGTLYHHYKSDDNGKATMVNMIVSTVQNNPAMNMCVKDVANKVISGKKIDEKLLNYIEMAIRAHDPCLSCATHAIGQMPMKVRMIDSKGVTMRELTK